MEKNCKKRILITGTAGFIGFHLARLLLKEGFQVHGYDGMTSYYDVGLKQRRHAMLLQNSAFSSTEGTGDTALSSTEGAGDTALSSTGGSD